MGADPLMLATAREAILTVARATGLNLYYAGPSSARFDSNLPRRGLLRQPILISFENRITVPRLAGPVIGIGRSQVLRKKSHRQLAAGRLVIDTEDYLNLVNDPLLAHLSTRALRATLLHELGHVMGLAHVGDPNQLMYPSQTASQFDFAAGDLAGLAILGSQPCGPARSGKATRKPGAKKIATRQRR